MDVYDNLPEEWRKERFMRMDKAMNKIDEIVEQLNEFHRLPKIAAGVTEIIDPKERENALEAVTNVMRFVSVNIVRIGELVNDGLTVPEEKP